MNTMMMLGWRYPNSSKGMCEVATVHNQACSIPVCVEEKINVKNEEGLQEKSRAASRQNARKESFHCKI